jgi:hypothetical protein
MTATPTRNFFFLNYQFIQFRRSWTSLPTPFISAQRLSERTVLAP